MPVALLDPKRLLLLRKMPPLFTARAGARDPSAIPSICRISAALQYPSGEARSVKGYRKKKSLSMDLCFCGYPIIITFV